MRNTEAVLLKGRLRTDLFKFSFFNSLPVTIRTADQLSLFKKKVNEFYIAKFNLNKDNIFIDL